MKVELWGIFTFHLNLTSSICSMSLSSNKVSKSAEYKRKRWCFFLFSFMSLLASSKDVALYSRGNRQSNSLEMSRYSSFCWRLDFMLPQHRMKHIGPDDNCNFSLCKDSTSDSFSLKSWNFVCGQINLYWYCYLWPSFSPHLVPFSLLD